MIQSKWVELPNTFSWELVEGDYYAFVSRSDENAYGYSVWFLEDLVHEGVRRTPTMAKLASLKLIYYSRQGGWSV